MKKMKKTKKQQKKQQHETAKKKLFLNELRWSHSVNTFQQWMS